MQVRGRIDQNIVGPLIRASNPQVIQILSNSLQVEIIFFVKNTEGSAPLSYKISLKVQWSVDMRSCAAVADFKAVLILAPIAVVVTMLLTYLCLKKALFGIRGRFVKLLLESLDYD